VTPLADEINMEEWPEENVVEESRNNTLGIISLVFGILGVLGALLCCCFSPVGSVLGIVALICGILGHQQKQQFALAGLILGAVAIFLGVVIFITLQLIPPEIIIGEEFMEEFMEEFLREMQQHK